MSDIHVDPSITDPVIRYNGQCYEFAEASQDNIDASPDSVFTNCQECEDAPSPSPSPVASPSPSPIEVGSFYCTTSWVGPSSGGCVAHFASLSQCFDWAGQVDNPPVVGSCYIDGGSPVFEVITVNSGPYADFTACSNAGCP